MVKYPLTSKEHQQLDDVWDFLEIFKINYIPSFQFGEFFDEVVFPLVLKSKRHIKNYPHLTKVTTQEELTSILSRIPHPEKFYWEKFTPYDREFRIHMSHYKHSDVFSTEKILRRDRVRGWIRNKESCVFKTKFDRPNEWVDILDSCRRVLDKTDLDIAGFDVAYDTTTGRHYIIEVNTACGMGDNTRRAYTKELNRIAIIKHFGL